MGVSAHFCVSVEEVRYGIVRLGGESRLKVHKREVVRMKLYRKINKITKRIALKNLSI